jgi:hypothetical protein
VRSEYSVYEADADEWISILRLACEWGFEKIKVFAVRNLDPKFNEPLEKIQLYHRYQVRPSPSAALPVVC